MKEGVDTPGPTDPGPGRRLGLDVGTVRIGVAVSDSAARIATPVETVRRVTGLDELRRGGTDLDSAPDVRRLVELCEEYGVVEVIVGLPRNLKAHGSTSVHQARGLAEALGRTLTGVPIRMADERLTTVAATHALRASGVSSRRGRSVIDQAAAVEILQSWLQARTAYFKRREQEGPAPARPTPGDVARRARPRPGASDSSQLPLPPTANEKE
ncbi:Holliday junction resolvase RuvX [Corynebacterium atypicum]|uniref:Holliday junction resolvase RuvX n=1 Tax=Corynebacterium atypicum TaxID=191610 RepID=UPI0006903DEA|nr:Holliday junction resolvase RuvX [Corynebacterium atypicum]